MDNSVAKNELPENMFYVTNLGDGETGIFQVTKNELIFTDQETTDVYMWPIKYIRKYGTDGEVFSFEAGRKCPFGEGLYAFESQFASDIFDMLATNINQTAIGLQSATHELSSFPSKIHVPDMDTLSSQPDSSVSQLHSHVHTNEPKYGSMDESVKRNSQPALSQRSVDYKEEVFDCPPEQHSISLDGISNEGKGLKWLLMFKSFQFSSPLALEYLVSAMPLSRYKYDKQNL